MYFILDNTNWFKLKEKIDSEELETEPASCGENVGQEREVIMEK